MAIIYEKGDSHGAKQRKKDTKVMLNYSKYCYDYYRNNINCIRFYTF